MTKIVKRVSTDVQETQDSKLLAVNCICKDEEYLKSKEIKGAF